MEGYESGLQRQMRGRTMWSKIVQNMITVSAIILVIWLYRMYKDQHCVYCTKKFYATCLLYLIFHLYILYLAVSYPGGGIFKLPMSHRIEINSEDINVTFNDVKGVSDELNYLHAIKGIGE